MNDNQEKTMLDKFLNFCDNKEGYSQIRQDLFALYCIGDKPGYFVEFGASDGVYLSNTFLLETYFDWDGLLVEPSTYYSPVLKKKRDVRIDTLCVSDKTGEMIDFVEVKDFYGLSGIAEYAYNDVHSDKRVNQGTIYKVETITLNDLLDKHNCPDVIDYISIDTEGSELAILSAYDFSRKFNVITVEHNNTYTQEPIDKLLTSHGYIRVLEEESKWDSWYVSQEVYERISQ